MVRVNGLFSSFYHAVVFTHTKNLPSSKSSSDNDAVQSPKHKQTFGEMFTFIYERSVFSVAFIICAACLVYRQEWMSH